MGTIVLNPGGSGSGSVGEERGGMNGQVSAVVSGNVVKIYKNDRQLYAANYTDYRDANNNVFATPAAVAEYIRNFFVEASVTPEEFTEAFGQKSLQDLKNGNDVVYADVSNFSASGVITERNIEGDYIVYSKSGTGNQWSSSPVFNPSGSHVVRIRFNVQFTRIGVHSKGLKIHVAAQAGVVAGKYHTIAEITTDGDHEITFDPSFYVVYHGYTQFCIWINNQNMEAGQSLQAKLTGLKVFERFNSVEGANISGENTKELFESVDTSITAVKNELQEAGVYKIAPDGKKYEIVVNNAGALTSVPVIPATGAFIGNSLLSGFGNYGMAASESTKDYYYLISEYIKTLNPSFSAIKTSGSTFEGLTSSGGITAAVTAITNLLTGNENLIIVQLGDNVNTPEKKAVFQESAVALLQAIRVKCPAGRVFWMGMWYGDSERYTTIENAVRKTGCYFVSFSDIVGAETISQIGWLTRKGTATRTLENVTSVTVNSPTNITVFFTVGATNYSSTLNINSHSLAATTLTYNSEYEIISAAGIASHPGDEGFKRIANRFLFQSKLSEEQETY